MNNYDYDNQPDPGDDPMIDPSDTFDAGRGVQMSDMNPIRDDGTTRVWSDHPDSLKHYGQEWQSDDALPMHAVLTIEAPDQMYLGLYFDGFADAEDLLELNHGIIKLVPEDVLWPSRLIRTCLLEDGNRCHLWEFESVEALTAALQAIGIAERPWLIDRLLTVNEEGEVVWRK